MKKPDSGLRRKQSGKRRTQPDKEHKKKLSKKPKPKLLHKLLH